MGKIKELLTVGGDEAFTKASNGTNEALLVIDILAAIFTLTLSTLYVFIDHKILLWVGLVLAYRGLVPHIWKSSKEFIALFKANLEEERKLRKLTDQKVKGKK